MKTSTDMKIVLVKPNYDTYNITPPLGLGYISSYLNRNGVETKIIDALRDNLSVDILMQKILSEKPEAVGITCLTASYNEVVELARLIKRNNVRCIIGGVHPTSLPYETLLDSGADYVICGEGEIALLELIKNNFINNNISGVYSKSDFENSKKVVKKAKIIKNLDDIPFPDWEQINPSSYPNAPHGIIARGFPVGPVITSRGCPYECTFCSSPNFCDRKIRFRSPQNVISEIKYLIDRFKVKEIHFEDDNLTLKQDHIRQICNLIIENEFKIDWATPNGIRADKISEELIRLMLKSGCYYFAYGIESANSKILQNIKKSIALCTIEKSIEIVHKAGGFCVGYFILGLPGETKETIEETISFAVRSKLSRAQFGLFDVLPGSELWDKLKGQFKPNWRKKAAKESEWIPEGLTNALLKEAQIKAFRRFYLRPNILISHLRFIKWNQIGHIIRILREYNLIKI